MHNELAYINCFKTTRRGSAPKGIKIEYTKKNASTSVIEVSMFEQLDIKDQDLFLLLLAIALNTKPLSSETEIKKWEELIKYLNITGTYEEDIVKTIETTAYNLLKLLRKSAGKNNYKWLYKSLEKLSKTNISKKEVEKDNNGKINSVRFIGGFSLIAVFYEYNKTKKVDKIKILLNPLSTKVFLENFEGGFRPINLSERFSLTTDTAKEVHYNLSILVNQGKKQYKLKEQTLIERLAGVNYNQLSPKEISNYRNKINKSINEINNLASWEITKTGDNFIITHKKNRKKELKLVNFDS